MSKEKRSKLISPSKTLLIEEIKLILERASGAKDVKVEYPNDSSHGDYASNIALQLTKELKKSPQEIAGSIIEKIREDTSAKELIEKVEMAGPGFINFFLSEKALTKETNEIIKEADKYGKNITSKDDSIVVEFSQPNIAKPLGVHHLLSTIIGQSLYNIFKHIGFNAIAINHIGDWGTQFGKLICAYKKWGDKKIIEKDPINELLKLYVKFHDEAEKDENLEDEGRHEFKIFEEGDKENRELWQWFVDESLKEINKTYDKIGGIHFDHTQGESFYEDKMQEIIDYGKENKIFTDGKEGALVAEYEDENTPPFVILKKDGATLYSTRDFAALKYRIKTWKPKKILYVVDIAQTLHFKQLLKTAEKFPWYSGEGDHVWFGRMHMKDGKMSTRKGSVILLEDVLDEAVDRAKKLIEEKNPDLKNKDEVARVLGIGAIKYNILSQNRTTDITFDWDIMLSFEGNSAPYLQYTYARAKSILRKAEKNAESEPTDEDKEKITEKTHSLTRLFPKFQEKLIESAEEYKPNILSTYLFDLAQKFNSFYNTVPVLRASKEKQSARLKIVEASSHILKTGLELLGVEVVEEM